MDIVIPYKQDPHNGLELKFALRSIEKYLTGYGAIHLIGDRPKWFAGYSTEFNQRTNGKEYDIKSRIVYAIDKIQELSDNFLMWHDDHSLLKLLDVSEIKYWYDGTLQDALKNNAKGYGRTIENTLDEFPDAKNFDIHTPIVFDKVWFKLFMDYTSEICLKSYYCAKAGITGEPMPDLKLNRPMVRGEIMAAIDKRLFFSTGPLSLIGEMVDVLDELFPEKSKFEK